MHPKVFQKLRAIIHRESGISLGEKKISLLENRLRKRLRALNLDNEQEYLRIIETDLEGEELVHLIDAISTNHTFFFRESTHFEFLAKLCKQWEVERRSEVRIWCAAASSGQEPYSIMMTLAENLDLRRTSCRLLATDICTPVLQKAMKGVYSLQEIGELQPRLMNEYFDKLGGDALYRVKKILREPILYKKLNLAHFPYPLKGPFDVIFCRNVMIYFENDLREQIASEMHRLLRPGGYLFVGHSESLSGIKHAFTTAGSATYLKEMKR